VMMSRNFSHGLDKALDMRVLGRTITLLCRDSKFTST
jgi:hypothetical protein